MALNVHTELMNVKFCRVVSGGASVYGRASEKFAYEFDFTSSDVTRMSCSPFSDGLQDGMEVVVQMLFSRMLLPEYVQMGRFLPAVR